MRASLRLSRPSGRDGAFTLLEVIVAVGIFSTVFVLFASGFREATGTGKVMTADAELRATAQSALARIVQDLRSTKSSQVNIDGMVTPTKTLTFFPIIGSQASAPYYVMPATKTSYSWDSTLVAGTSGNWTVSWTASKLVLTPYNAPAVPIAGEVTNFKVTALDPATGLPTSQTSGFSATTAQTFEIVLELTRRAAQQPTSSDPDGKLSVTLKTRVTVPPG